MHAVMEMILPIRLFGRTPSISAAKPANMAILIKFDAIEQLRSFLCRRYHGIGLVCPASAKSETASVGGPLLHIRDARYFLVSSGFTGAAAPSLSLLILPFVLLMLVVSIEPSGLAPFAMIRWPGSKIAIPERKYET